MGCYVIRRSRSGHKLLAKPRAYPSCNYQEKALEKAQYEIRLKLTGWSQKYKVPSLLTREVKMEKTWKPTTAGILSIIAGSLGAISGIVIAVVGGAIAAGLKFIPAIPEIFSTVAIPVIGGIGIPRIILGIVAILGGVYALERRKWGLAFAGSICSLFCVFFLGIPAIIFVAMAKDEFEPKNT